jgi:energy-converting hydrogenase Eha subunit E
MKAGMILFVGLVVVVSFFLAMFAHPAAWILFAATLFFLVTLLIRGLLRQNRQNREP